MSAELQNKWPALDYTRLHQFAANPEFRARIGFYYDGYFYVGGQTTCVAADLAAWDFWRFGRWRGPAPLRAVPSGLSIDGAVLEDTDPTAPYAQRGTFPAGTVATCGLLYGEQLTQFEIEWRIYSCATGLPVGSGTKTGTLYAYQAFSLPELAPGSYTLWARLSGVQVPPITEEFYRSITGLDVALKYEYSEDGQNYFWDFDRNLGRLPTDSESILYTEREQVMADGAQLDRPEWAQYISSGDPAAGEWSLLRIHVGAGAWTAPTLYDCSPGPALFRKSEAALLTTPEGDILGAAMATVRFDVAARNVSAATVTRDGRLLVAGNRASEDGPQLALWQFDGAAWTLLGLNPNLSNGICECSLSSHDCGSVLEARDGSIYVLSKCSGHRHQAGPLDALERLPDYPPSTHGHPGGQCLRELPNGRALYWLTEYFGSGGVNQNSQTAQFYNTLTSFAAGGRTTTSGIGTVCHGPNAMTIFRGALTGIVQDLPHSNPAAKARLARIEGATWNYAAPEWPASSYMLQGLEAAQGKLICHGVETNSELPVWAVFDPADGDGVLQFARMPFRAERIEKIQRGGAEQLLIVGKEVTAPDADLDEIPYSLVLLPFKMGTPYVHFCLHWNGTDSFEIPIADLPAGYTAAAAPAYLAYAPSTGGPGYWIPRPTVPATPYLQRVITSDLLAFQLHGAPPYDFSQYDRICYTGTESTDGGWGGPYLEPEPSPRNGKDAKDGMPDDTCEQVLDVPISRDWWALQIDDCDAEQPLARCVRDYPSIWISFDTVSDPTDLSIYDIRVPRINDKGRFDLPRTLTPETDAGFRVLFLWPPTLRGESYAVKKYSIQPME